MSDLMSKRVVAYISQRLRPTNDIAREFKEMITAPSVVYGILECQ